MWLGYFCRAKGQRDFKSTLAFLASHEAYRRMAVFTRQQTGSRTRAAVTPRPSRMSLYTPARLQRAVRGQGVLPLVRAMRPIAEWRSMLCTKQGTTPDPRGPSPSSGKTPAKPHVPRTPPRPKGAVWGAGRREEDTRRVVHGTTRSAFGRLNFSNKI